MREIEVKGLIQGECSRVVVERQVGLSTFHVKDVLLKTGDYFCNIADANGSAGWGLEVLVTGER